MKELLLSTGIGLFSYVLIKHIIKEKKANTAICVLNNFGTVRFTQTSNNKTLIECNLMNFSQYV